MSQANSTVTGQSEPVETSHKNKWIGVEFEECQRMVDYAKRREPMVKFMLEKIKEVTA